MPKWYLNPDGTFPTDADGKPMFVRKEDILCCCCKLCRWRVIYVWDCVLLDWVEYEEPTWVCGEGETGEDPSSTLCQRIIYSELYSCDIDPKPDIPEKPEALTPAEQDLCETVTTCPPSLMDEYILEPGLIIDREWADSESCPEFEPSSATRFQLELTSPISMKRSGSLCRIVADLDQWLQHARQRRYFCEWGPWEPVDPILPNQIWVGLVPAIAGGGWRMEYGNPGSFGGTIIGSRICSEDIRGTYSIYIDQPTLGGGTQRRGRIS